jgi:hypothetical protein
MTDCGKSFGFKVGKFSASGYDSPENALAGAKKTLTRHFQDKKESECLEGDCPRGMKCTLTWSTKELDGLLNGLDVDEYYDEDMNFSYGVDVPEHEFMLACKCRHRPKAKDKGEIV